MKQVNALEALEKEKESRVEDLGGKQVRSGAWRVLAIVVVFLLVAVGVVGGIYYMKVVRDAKEQDKGLKSGGAETVVGGAVAKALSRPVGEAAYGPDNRAREEAERKKREEERKAAEKAEEEAKSRGKGRASVEVTGPVYSEEVRARKLAAEDWGTMDDSSSSSAGGNGVGGSSDGSFASENGGDGLESKVEPVVLSIAKAGRLKNRDLILTQGNYIPCIMPNRLDTSLSGFISCVVTEDVYGSTGKVKLIDKFTKVTGRQEGGVVKGANRIFASWDRLETPEGVFINLGSPAVDSLGAPGIGGTLETHWWERFGNAILLSVFQDAISTGFDNLNKNKESGNSVSISTSSTSGSMQDMASEALKNSIDIPNTLYSPHAGVISIYVARDLDFSGVYDLEYTE